MRVGVGACSLEVEDRGVGVPFMLLHGFPLSSEAWSPLRPATEEVARLVTPDLRGFGRSDKPDGDYSMDALADDVLRIADALTLDRFVLGGHSMGGYVAFRVAERARERVLGLVLVDTRGDADTQEGKARRAASMARIGREGGAAFLDEFVANLVGPTTRARAGRFVRDLRGMAADVPDHVLIGCLDGMRRRPDSMPLLPKLDVPALVVVGHEDTLTPVDAAQTMAAALPQATLVVIPSSGHTPSVERPIATGTAITDFLRANFPARVRIQTLRH